MKCNYLPNSHAEQGAHIDQGRVNGCHDGRGERGAYSPLGATARTDDGATPLELQARIKLKERSDHHQFTSGEWFTVPAGNGASGYIRFKMETDFRRRASHHIIRSHDDGIGPIFPNFGRQTAFSSGQCEPPSSDIIG